MKWKIKVRLERDGKKWTEVFYNKSTEAHEAIKFVLKAVERSPDLKSATMIGFNVEYLDPGRFCTQQFGILAKDKKKI